MQTDEGEAPEEPAKEAATPGRLASMLAKAREKDVAFYVYLAARIMSGVVKIYIVKYLVALMSKPVMGQWVYLGKVGMALVPLVSLSLPAAMQRWYFDRKSGDKVGQAVLISTTFKLLLGAGALLALGSGVLYLTGVSSHWALAYFGTLTPAMIFIRYYNYVTRTRNDYILYFVNACSQSLLIVAIIATLVTVWGDTRLPGAEQHDRLLAAILVYAGCAWGMVLFNTAYYVWQGFLRLRLPSLPWKEIKALCKFSIPLSGTFFLGWTLQAADVVILEAYGLREDVAEYGVAVGIAAAVAVITQSALSDWPPFFYKKMRDNPADRDALIAKRVRKFLWMHVGAIAVLRLVATFAYDLLNADDYRAGMAYIDYLVLGNFFLLAGNMFAVGLGYAKKTHLTVVCFAVPGILNVVLNIYFAPEYGALGAAVTTAVSYFLLAAFSWFLGERFYSFTERGKLAGVIATAVVVALFPLRWIAEAFGL